MVKEPLRGFNIAITGEFGERRTSDKMKQWIQRNGGKFANEISFKVTHLICSKAHFKKQVAMGMRTLLAYTLLSFFAMHSCIVQSLLFYPIPRNSSHLLAP